MSVHFGGEDVKVGMRRGQEPRCLLLTIVPPHRGVAAVPLVAT